MSSPDFSFSNAGVIPERTPAVLDGSTSNVFQKLIGKYKDEIAAFLASHIGFEDDDLDWEGVRPLGQGNFGAVGLWVGKDKNGSNVKVSSTKGTITSSAHGSRKSLSNSAIGPERQSGTQRHGYLQKP